MLYSPRGSQRVGQTEQLSLAWEEGQKEGAATMWSEGALHIVPSLEAAINTRLGRFHAPRFVFLVSVLANHTQQ